MKIRLINYLRNIKIPLIITGILIAVIFFVIAIVTLPPKLTPPSSIYTSEILEPYKKQKLSELYQKIISALEKQDWSTVYDLDTSSSFKTFISKGEYVEHEKARLSGTKIISEKYKINSIQVTNNKGVINRTETVCREEGCSSGDLSSAFTANVEFSYINEAWQRAQEEKPSERALKAVSYAYENTSQSEKKEIIVRFGDSYDTPIYAVHNWAILLDSDLQELIRIETINEKDKAERSRPIYNPQPAQVIQQAAPVIQQNTSPKHCTSNTIGNYTYTNCY